MFHRKGRRTPFQREQDQKLENLRDDCVALFLDSGMTQKQIHERGGPTPQTISKWLYGETHFPRYATVEAFLAALGHELMPVSSALAAQMRERGRNSFLDIQLSFVGRPKMPQKGKKNVTRSSALRSYTNSRTYRPSSADRRKARSVR